MAVKLAHAMGAEVHPVHHLARQGGRLPAGSARPVVLETPSPAMSPDKRKFDTSISFSTPSPCPLDLDPYVHGARPCDGTAWCMNGLKNRSEPSVFNRC